MAFGRLGAMGGGFGHLGASTGGPSSSAGGAALLAGETDGFATDFTYATDAQRVAKKVAGGVTEYGLDSFFSNNGASPVALVYDVTGALVWSPHNMFLNSAAPVTQSVTTVVGQNYTVTVTGSGSMTGSAGASGVATAGAPLTYVATTTTSTFTKAGTVTQIQMNRGSVATAYIATTAAARYGLAVDYDPVTHVALGLPIEPAATNLILNNATMSTQSVTVTAVAHTLSFFGTGTITLTGTSTAGPLVGTGASNRVSLTFTPTAGSLTLTVTGTASLAQLETGTIASSVIPTFAATATRALSIPLITPASINYSATAGTWWAEFYCKAFTAGSIRIVALQASAAFPLATQSATTIQLSDSTALVSTSAGALVANVRRGACAFQSGARSIAYAGAAVTSDAGSTAALLSPGTSIYFGSGNGASPFTGYIRKVFYLPRKMSNAELVTKTT